MPGILFAAGIFTFALGYSLSPSVTEAHFTAWVIPSICAGLTIVFMVASVAVHFFSRS